MTMCYLTAVLAHLRWLDTQASTARVVTVIAFVAALLAHEGAVTLLPTLLLVDLMFASGWRIPMRDLARRYGLFALLLVGYLAISFAVNRANSNVIEGEYRVGIHAVRNLLEYVSTLYVGRHGAFALLGTASGAAAGRPLRRDAGQVRYGVDAAGAGALQPVRDHAAVADMRICRLPASRCCWPESW